MRYVARLGDASQGAKKVALYGSNIYDATRIDSFLDSIACFEAAVGPWMYTASKQPWARFGREEVARHEGQTRKIMAGFDQALKENKFFVGNTLTLADIAWWCSVRRPFTLLFTKEYVKEIPHAVAHFRRLEAMKEFQSVVKESVVFPDAVNLEFPHEVPAPPVRYHRLATISDGKQSMKLKLYPDSKACDIQEAIRSRFKLGEKQPLILVDEDNCDVVIDGTLETGNYKLTN